MNGKGRCVVEPFSDEHYIKVLDHLWKMYQDAADLYLPELERSGKKQAYEFYGREMTRLADVHFRILNRAIREGRNLEIQ